MKKNISLNKLIILLSVLFTIASCKKDFLKETLTTAYGNSFYQTDAGILQLAAGTYYQVLASPTNGEWIYCATNYGTDEFHIGGDPSNSPWNNYDATFNSVNIGSNGNVALANFQWDALYLGIGDANLLIQNCNASTSTSIAIKNTALGEGYFLRAYNYLRLVSQYGAVPLQLDPLSTVKTDFARDSAQKVYAQIISDFSKALTLLPTAGGPARITQDAAAHYLAKAYLSRASEINDSWNSSTKAADLAAIVPLCDRVIANHALASDFAKIFNFTGVNSANETLPEVVLSAQFVNDVNTNLATGPTQHLYFVSRYDVQDQMQRDLTGDRPFSRLGTTYYMYRVYDLVNDSRFWKSFRTKSAINANAPTAPNVQGDLGIMFVINQPGDTRFPLSKISKATVGSANLIKDVLYNPTKPIPTVYAIYPNGSSTDGAIYNDLTTAGQGFPSMSKYLDGSRNSLNDVVGHRDFILARSAETYLIAAEAKIRLAAMGTGAYADALPYINAVRTRAQFANGEIRSKYNDGGNTLTAGLQPVGLTSFYSGNSYYESNNIATTTAASSPLAVATISPLPAQDEYIITKMGYSSPYDRMMCFLMNEKSRELCGEFKRWEDLSRTKTLVKRVQVFNPEGGANVKDFHNLRPIPQTFLDGITASGTVLTAAQKQAMQNPGY